MSGPVVVTNCGELRGVKEKSSEGFDYCAFKGIPYAEPPKGGLRFKDPVPIKKWIGVKNATSYGPVCAQCDVFLGILTDNEDCLYLNVYTKSISGSKPVMVYFHGGAFYFGCATDKFYGPDYLISKDVVLVTVGFRLSLFGFLDLEDEIAPGNQGLKDQVLALQWVKNNIHLFGGDANNVTIFGESAGGSAVHCLTLSPLAKGLFHKAISQSGVAYNPWVRSRNSRENAKKLCSLLGKNLTEPREILEFLRTINAKTLVETQEKLRKQLKALPFGPGIDNKSPNPFMPVPPEVAAEQGVHIPYLIGHNSSEGTFFLLGISKKDGFAIIDQRFETAISLNSKYVLEEYNLTPNQIRRLYYKNEKVSEKNTEKYAEFAGDLFIVVGIHKFIKSQVEKSSAPVYMYYFSHDPGSSITRALIREKIPGACHFDDVGYIFKMNILTMLGHPHLRKGTSEHKIMQQMTEMWTNFAKYGKPTIEISELIPLHWQPVTDGTVFRCLNIDEDLKMQCMLNIEEKLASARYIKN